MYKSKPIAVTVILLIGLILLLSFNISAQEQMKTERRWSAPPEADTLQNPFHGSEKATMAGKEIFQSTCSVCHGPKGKGDGPGAAALQPKPANLSADSVQTQSDGAIFWKITTGNLPMASYKDIYSEEQRWQLVQYIRELGGENSMDKKK